MLQYSKTTSLPIVLAAATLLQFSQSPAASENASNPLAAVSNLDFRLKTYDLEQGDREEFFLDGASMLNPKLKLKYQLHWWQTDVTGRDESGRESASVKLIHFPRSGKLESGRPYRLAVGLEWIVDLGDEDKGIGSGADQLAPFVGVAINFKPGLVLIPLIQHFENYSGNDISKTSGRIIALQTLDHGKWLKTDFKLPYDWENETWPASLELQLGRKFSPGLSGYIDAQVGLGEDRPYDSVLGIGIRLHL